MLKKRKKSESGFSLAIACQPFQFILKNKSQNSRAQKLQIHNRARGRLPDFLLFFTNCIWGGGGENLNGQYLGNFLNNGANFFFLMP